MLKYQVDLLDCWQDHTEDHPNQESAGIDIIYLTNSTVLEPNLRHTAATSAHFGSFSKTAGAVMVWPFNFSKPSPP